MASDMDQSSCTKSDETGRGKIFLAHGQQNADDSADDGLGSSTLDPEVLIPDKKVVDGLPTVEVENDYDHFFENYVLFLIDEKTKSGSQFKSRKVVIDAGPYRPYIVRWERSGDTLCLDFYSPCRFAQGPDAYNDDIMAVL